MEESRTIVVVLRSGGDFSFRDVELITRHINGKWQSPIPPRIICLWDNASQEYDLGNIHIIPLRTNQKGTWSRIELYSPEMEKYRPFLYIDLDTAVIQSLEHIFALVTDESKFITLEDFWQRGQIATGLVWVPAKSKKVAKIWKEFKGSQGSRMDNYIRKVIEPDAYWQQLTPTIFDFKPKVGKLLTEIPNTANLICFHGKPRIFTCVEGSITIAWVKQYVNQAFSRPLSEDFLVTVIIPYKEDRGWLQQAIDSIPDGVQILLSQGEGNWPQNFNKALPLAKGKYIKYLHEDDMLAPGCIENSIQAIEEQGVDFIHGDATEVNENGGRKKTIKSPIPSPTIENLLEKNIIHSATLMYKREVFEKVGGFNESPKIKSFEEFEFNLRCLKAGLRVGYCNKILAYYRRHPNQLIKTTDKKQREIYRAELISEYTV